MERKLLREAQVNLAIRWFAGYRLHEQLPDHSSLTRIRQRGGAERFRRIFERSVVEMMTYVHANPVRRGLVKDPLESRWSMDYLSVTHVSEHL